MNNNESKIRDNHFEIYCCPDCHSNLVYSNSCLVCPKCKKTFQIINSIPDFRLSRYQSSVADLENILKRQDKELTHDDVVAANTIFYNEIGEKYELTPEILRSNKNKRVQQRTREALEKISSKYSLRSSLLDMGCGTGFVMDMSKGIFEQAIGLDCSLNMVSVAKNKGHRVCCADIIRTPFKPNTFDMVVASGVLHHLYDSFDMLVETFRILKEGGILFIDFEPNQFFQKKINRYGMFYRLAEQLLYNCYFIFKRSISKENKYGKYRKAMSSIEMISEYHHFKTKGLEEEDLRSELASVGFTDAEIIFHGNCESIFRPRIPIDERIMAMIAQVVSGNFSFLWDNSLKGNACHIAIVARKPKN